MFGFSYKFSVDKNIDNLNDIIILEEENKNIFVTDKVSFDYLKGASVDWVESLTNSQFTISNPIAKSSCGCGSLFQYDKSVNCYLNVNSIRARLNVLLNG